MTRPPTISFLSDYGTADEFVGVVKSVIRQLAPDALVIDVTHEVPRSRRAGRRPHAGPRRPVPGAGRRAGGGRPRGRDRSAGDRGRGRRRRIGAGRTGQRPAGPGGRHGRRGHPGLRAHQHRAPPRGPGPHLRRARRVRPGGRPPLHRRAPRGARPRDRPDHAAARDPARSSREEDGGIAAEVLWVDRFGNVQLNVDPAELEPLRRARSRVVIGESARSGRPGPGLRRRRTGRDRPDHRLLRPAWRSSSTGARRPRSSASAPAARCGSSPTPTTAPTPSAAPPSSAPSDCPAAQEPTTDETRHHHRPRRPPRPHLRRRR